MEIQRYLPRDTAYFLRQSEMVKPVMENLNFAFQEGVINSTNEKQQDTSKILESKKVQNKIFQIAEKYVRYSALTELTQESSDISDISELKSRCDDFKESYLADLEQVFIDLKFNRTEKSYTYNALEQILAEGALKHSSETKDNFKKQAGLYRNFHVNFDSAAATGVALPKYDLIISKIDNLEQKYLKTDKLQETFASKTDYVIWQLFEEKLQDNYSYTSSSNQVAKMLNIDNSKIEKSLLKSVTDISGLELKSGVLPVYKSQFIKSSLEVIAKANSYMMVFDEFEQSLDVKIDDDLKPNLKDLLLVENFQIQLPSNSIIKPDLISRCAIDTANKFKNISTNDLMESFVKTKFLQILNALHINKQAINEDSLIEKFVQKKVPTELTCKDLIDLLYERAGLSLDKEFNDKASFKQDFEQNFLKSDKVELVLNHLEADNSKLSVHLKNKLIAYKATHKTEFSDLDQKLLQQIYKKLNPTPEYSEHNEKFTDLAFISQNKALSDLDKILPENTFLSNYIEDKLNYYGDYKVKFSDQDKNLLDKTIFQLYHDTKIKLSKSDNQDEIKSLHKLLDFIYEDFRQVLKKMDVRAVDLYENKSVDEHIADFLRHAREDLLNKYAADFENKPRTEQLKILKQEFGSPEDILKKMLQNQTKLIETFNSLSNLMNENFSTAKNASNLHKRMMNSLKYVPS
jgi:hypothetical protein